MNEITMNFSLNRALDEMVELVRRGEDMRYIASEFMVSPGILHNLRKGSKLERLIRESERSIDEQGFSFWQPPPSMVGLVETVRAAMLDAPDDAAAREVVLSILREDDPALIAAVAVG